MGPITIENFVIYAIMNQIGLPCNVGSIIGYYLASSVSGQDGLNLVLGLLLE